MILMRFLAGILCFIGTWLCYRQQTTAYLVAALILAALGFAFWGIIEIFGDVLDGIGD